MDFLPTDDEVMLRDSARRALADAGTGAGDRWPVFTELGWLMAALPEAVDGLDGGPRAAAILAEELGRVLAPEPYVDVAITAAQALLDHAPDLVSGIAAGETRIVFAHSEAEARGEPGWIGTQARPDGDGFRLTGIKTGIIGGTDAERLLVSAVVPDAGPTLFLLSPDTGERLAHELIDGRIAIELRLADTWVDRASVVGPVGGAAPAIVRAFDHALVIGSAEALGTMQAAFDLTRDYLLTRRQYGVLIGDFQALRHRLADMFVELEQARSIVARGVDALANAAPLERAMMAAATKARTAQAGRFVTSQAIQLHGGIGVTQEYPVGNMFTRLVAFDLRYGAADAHVGRFARLSREARAA
jgi:alkylation response protein AidB-like acyl-CoA dehydrogenase